MSTDAEAREALIAETTLTLETVAIEALRAGAVPSYNGLRAVAERVVERAIAHAETRKEARS